jgi:hypothetical protein
MVDMKKLMDAIERGIKGGDEKKVPNSSVIIEATDMFHVYEFRNGTLLNSFHSHSIDDVAQEVAKFFEVPVTWRYGIKYEWKEYLGTITIIFRELYGQWVQIFIDKGYRFDELVIHPTLDECIDHWSLFSGIEMW